MTSPDASRWRAFWAAALGWLFDGYENYVLVLVAHLAVRDVLPAADLRDLPTFIGGLLAATLLGWATGGVLCGVLSDYIGRKRTLMLSILCYALLTGLTAFAHSYGALLVFRFMTGLGLGGEWGPGAAMVGELWPASARGRACAALQAAFGVGMLLASVLWLVVGPLGAQSWRHMFLIGVLPALIVLYIRKGLDDPSLWVAADERRRAVRAAAARGEAVADADRRLLQSTIGHLLADSALRRRLIILLGMSLASIVGFWAVSTWIPQHASRIAELAGRHGRAWGTLAGLSVSVGSIVGYVMFGVLADLWGRKLTAWLYFLGSLPAIWVPFLLVHDPWLFVLSVGLIGLFVSGQFAWMPIYLPEVFPTAVRGTAMSLVFNSARYVATLGPLAAGWAITTFGGIPEAVSIIALIYVVGLVLTPFAGPETRGRPLPP